MKLAEALIIRADLQKRIEHLSKRMQRNSKIQEGESPLEDPKQLLTEFDDLANELRDLVQRINRTNSSSSLVGEPSLTIADAIALRDSLRLSHKIYKELCESAAFFDRPRYSRSEIKFLPAFDVREVQARSDTFARQHRELDARIQESNWLVDLAD
jgi:hypothetical protein